MGCTNCTKKLVKTVTKKEDSVVNGVILKNANIGHYYMENIGATISLSKLAKWCRYCNTNTPDALGKSEDSIKSLKAFYASRQNEFSQLIAYGMPSRLRWCIWKLALQYDKYYKEGEYERLLAEKTSADINDQIQKDVNRTFSTHAFYSELYNGKTAIQNILETYSKYSPAAQYCQGMNFYAGFLMLLSGNNEIEAFWMLVIFMKSNIIKSPPIELEGFFIDGFPALDPAMKVFDKAFAKYAPKLKQHMDEISYVNILWVHKWIMTLFLYSFPQHFCIRMWDELILLGIDYVYNLMIAFIILVESDLIGKDTAEVNIFFREQLNDHEAVKDPMKVIKKAKQISIDW